MEANDFIAKLKADGSDKDLTNLDKVYNDYKSKLTNLPTKDRGLFSLNVLCTLCRNLDKVPSWTSRIDCCPLLTITIDCVRETRNMERTDRVKTLACIYHIHRHVIKQATHIPPELVLKLSFMPFELDTKHLLGEYSKTYWNILSDRLTYIEKLKNVPITKLMPKIMEDMLKTIELYETVQFCTNILVYVIKKLNYLFNGSPKELNRCYLEIFKKLSLKDLKPFKKLKETETLDVYVKLNECLCVVAETSVKLCFKDSPLDSIVRYCISILGHSPDLFHCFQTFYSNTFCSVFTSDNGTYTKTVLNGLLTNFELTEKLGYKKAMMATYPFLIKFLSLFIDYNVTNIVKRPWKDYFDIPTQEICMKIMLILMEKQKKCKQLLKCENCTLQSGLHDSLRISFLLKHFITVSLNQNLILTDNQSVILNIVHQQYNVITELKRLKCANHEKCFRKNQTDIHNCAILLNKSQYYEFSIKLFNIYLQNEISQDNIDAKNIARALYNKSICELDAKLFKDALVDAFLSLIFSQIEGPITEKYMSLVMDIKSKEIKENLEEKLDSENKINDLQYLTVVDAFNIALDNNLYGVKHCLKELPFKALLEHEFFMYCKLWPSLAPVAGVWNTLFNIYNKKYDSLITVDKETIFWSLIRIILETASNIRTVHHENYQNIITEILKIIENMQSSTDLKIIHSALLFINTEYNMAASSNKYGWKYNELKQTSDPDQIPANRTLPQEHDALKDSFKALIILKDVVKELNTVNNQENLRASLPIYQVFVYQFLHLSRLAQALQLAYILCDISEFLNDTKNYVKNAGVILYHSVVNSKELNELLKKSVEKYAKLKSIEHTETAVIFLCEMAIYYSNIGSEGEAAMLVQFAQCKLLQAQELHPEINVEMAIGRLMEAQMLICRSGPTILTAVNSTQRHYLGVISTASKWTTRRSYTLSLRYNTACVSVIASKRMRQLYLRRRAMSAAVASLPTAGAIFRAKLYMQITDTAVFDDAQIKIDNRLKHVLGLQSTNEVQPYYAPQNKQQPSSEVIEPMRENLIFKKNQTSPSLPCIMVPSFKIHDFILHNEKCECYACSMPISFLIACKITCLEASMYFRANEFDIAQNYFDGALDMLCLVEKKFKENWVDFDEFISKNVQELYLKELRTVEVELLIELCFYELKMKRYDNVDDYLVRIHEAHQELSSSDGYLEAEIWNLMLASAQARKVKKQSKIEDLEIEFDKLKLSPNEVPKTPQCKGKPPKESTKKICKDEEIYKKRKVIKLNLDDCPDDFEKPKSRAKFKIPEPKLSKPALEIATPNPKTAKKNPKIVVTQPSVDGTPSTGKQPDFFTPYESPEQFFTPLSNIKTYPKKTLRQNIVKNLENEFSTPKTVEKENLRVTTSKKRSEVKNNIKRATSPGKLCNINKEKSPTPRTRRLRKNVFSLDQDDRK